MTHEEMLRRYDLEEIEELDRRDAMVYNQALKDVLDVLRVWEDSKEKFVEYLELRIEVQKKIID